MSIVACTCINEYKEGLEKQKYLLPVHVLKNQYLNDEFIEEESFSMKNKKFPTLDWFKCQVKNYFVLSISIIFKTINPQLPSFVSYNFTKFYMQNYQCLASNVKDKSKNQMI